MARPLAASSNNPFRRKSAATFVTPPSSAPTHCSHLSTDATYSAPTQSQASEAASEASEASDAFGLDAEPVVLAVPPPLQAKKKQKKVRVPSPPPASSPETDQPVCPPLRYDPNGEKDDHDAYQRGDTSSQDQQQRPPPPSSPSSSRRPPPNPFYKALQGMEQGQEYHQHVSGAGLAASAKGTLNVDAFKRLLLTGQGDVDALNSHNTPEEMHPTALTDHSHGTRDPPFAAGPIAPGQLRHDTPQSLGNVALMDRNEGDTKRLISTVDEKSAKKPPPPPPPASRRGSRRGKLVGKRAPIACGEGLGVVSPLTALPPVQTDVNKSLPPGPNPTLDVNEDLGSPFGHEAADSMFDSDEDPPPRPPTPPKPSHTGSTGSLPAPAKKPAAPPPRRHGHARNDSKAPLAGPPPSPGNPIDAVETPPRRPSVESTRSRSSSLRISVYGPPPPPPRRQTLGATRPSSSAVPSSSTASFGGSPSVASSVGSDALQVQGASRLDGSPEGARTTSDPPSKPSSPSALKLSSGPPPPPPARNPSVRAKRAPSVSSMEGISRRTSGREKGGGSVGVGAPTTPPPPPPPPPPPRLRGDSRSSLEDTSAGGHGSTASWTAGLDSSHPKEHQPNVLSAVVAEEESDEGGALEAASVATDILAHLDALQQEVDALRGRYAS